jgi:hypothetical protein
MESLVERRAPEFRRVPVDLIVQLAPEEDDAEPYEAEAFDLSRGGMGLRSAVLPEVGQRLRCRFQLAESESTCEAIGEVVWVHELGRWGGAFGVRFELVDAETAHLLDALVPCPEDPPTDPGLLRVVRVHLDGVSKPFDAELSDEGACLAIEQSLPVLAIGRGVEIESTEGRIRGVIDAVRLRIDGHVPRLRIEIATDHTRREPPHSSDATLRDVPLQETVAHVETGDLDRGPPSPGAREVAPLPEESPAAADERSREPVDAAPHEPVDAVSHQPLRAAPGEPVDRHELREASMLRSHLHVFGRAVQPALARAGEEIRSLAAAIAVRRKQSWLKVREASVAVWRFLVGAVASGLPRLQAIAGRSPRRRTTAAPPATSSVSPSPRPRRASPTKTVRGKGRVLVIAGAAGVVLSVVAYGARPTDAEPDAVQPDPIVESSSESSPRPATPTPSVTTPETLEARPLLEGATTAAGQPLEGSLGSATELREPRAIPERTLAAGPVPWPADPYRVDGRRDATTPGTTPAGGTSGSGSAIPTHVAPPTSAAGAPTPEPLPMEFGDAEVPGGRTIALRMSAPIRGLEGVREPTGFTVTVRGALSLDRASPIAANHSAIERASILNRGDHCVLTIRFVTGRAPRYRVVARDTMLEITIGR